jgi:hypothetical protein
MTELGHAASNWLILTDFASKYKISVSTLRRRIKAGTINHKFEEGRYLLADEAPADMHQNYATPMARFAPLSNNIVDVEEPRSIETGDRLKELSHQGEEPILSTATRLLNELKRAYSNILQEKEEQLLQLKEEVVDLKTLVRVLESDNDRMRAILQKWGSA